MTRASSLIRQSPDNISLVFVPMPFLNVNFFGWGGMEGGTGSGGSLKLSKKKSLRFGGCVEGVGKFCLGNSGRR